MKRLLSFIPALAFVLILSGSAFGQTLNSSINAEATVVTNISEDKTQDVIFGQIPQDIQNTTPALDPTADDGAPVGVSGGTVQIGYIVFSGNNGATLSVTNPGATELTNGGYSIDFTPTLCYDDGDATTNNSSCSNTAEANGTDVTIDGTGDYTFGGTGTIWIGGELSNPLDDTDSSTSSLTNGTYNGSVSFTVDYTFSS
ncbi:hypothetical protein [Halalkalibaculum sp. DA384]|uniref:hypothetical protein n=1 Tax=Halalkalibaculum sp. DA384 TaxID=3373606 RepID=UPI003754F790